MPRFRPTLAISRSRISGSASFRPIASSSSMNTSSGTRRPKCASDFAGNEFRYERQWTLSRAPEFQNVEALIVAFHNGRQRTALAQRRDIARHANRSQHCSDST